MPGIRPWCIDCHTTNGSYHQYTLTYDGPRHPNTGEALVEAIRDKMLPEVGRMLEKKTGFKSFVYGNFLRDRTKWETYGHTPRYSTQYVGMRGIGILVRVVQLRPVQRSHHRQPGIRAGLARISGSP